MKHDPTVFDEHRGMAAQQATEIRRRLAEVEADQAALRERRTELEKFLLAAPASNWFEAAGKARYLIGLFAATSVGRDPRRQKLIGGVSWTISAGCRASRQRGCRPSASQMPVVGQ
jgi:hypothetical protein